MQFLIYNLINVMHTGNWNIGKLQMTMTVARFLAYHTPIKDTGKSFLEYDVMTSDRYTFMASCRTETRPNFRSLLDKPIFPELALSVELGYVGMSSFSDISKLYDTATGEVYASNINQVVSVDKTTRRPTPLPEWWKEKYANYSVNNKGLVIPLLTPPEEMGHTFEVRASWNDVDSNQHVNYVAYIRFCLDAAMDALVHGKFRKLQKDILAYQVKCMDIAYKKECNGGDWLRVSLWQDIKNPYVLYFDVTKDGETLFQNTMEFYSDFTE